MSYITHIGTATPENHFDQSGIEEFMVRVMRPDRMEERKIRAVFRASGVRSRYSVLTDYGRTENFTFYPEKPGDPFPGTDARMKLYRHYALPLSLAAIRAMTSGTTTDLLSPVTHLIVVSCTGMYAPGLDIDIVRALGLSHSVDRTCINFMGCYAAFNALKAADAFVRSDPSARVLIVCTELCSIHFQHTPTEDNMLANALFSDGAAAMIVQANAGERALSLEKFHNDLAIDGERDMAWCVGDYGFEMRLSSFIPDLIRSEISGLTKNLLSKLGIQRTDVKYFSFHPGGRRIIEAIGEQLDIPAASLKVSYDVLERYGNMSSPTVVFVLNEVFRSLTSDDHDSIVLGAAFGPGLTLESMLLKAHIN